MFDQAIELNEKTKAIAALIDDFLVHSNVDVPVLPTVVSKVITASKNPATDARRLAALLQSDQAVAAHIMKIANSPFYSYGGPLVSLQQAIARLGLTMISGVAVSFSFNAKMFEAPGYETEITEMWQHALATALWSKEIARACRKNVEAVFLCGLLHSIGRPSSLEKVVQVTGDSDNDFSREECLGLVEKYQQKFGMQIVDEWKMPTLVCDVVKHFYDFENAGDAMDATAIVFTASKFATFMLAPDLVSEDDLRDLETLEAINLYPDQIESLIEKFEDIKISMEMMSS